MDRLRRSINSLESSLTTLDDCDWTKRQWKLGHIKRYGKASERPGETKIITWQTKSRILITSVASQICSSWMSLSVPRAVICFASSCNLSHNSLARWTTHIKMNNEIIDLILIAEAFSQHFCRDGGLESHDSSRTWVASLRTWDFLD